MENPKNLLGKEFNLDKLLELRVELERYIEIINEHVITSKTDLKGNIVYVSKAFLEISGFEEQELLGSNHRIVRHPDMDNELFKDMWDTITKRQTWSGEIKNARKDGSFYWVNAKVTPTYDSLGNHIGYTSVRQDITDKKRIEELSLTDELTKLYNRRYFNQVFTTELHRACRDEKVFSFVILDVDNFKKYNDNYGHKKGDIVLQKVASYLKDSLKRATDIVFRLGGEEFGIIYSTNTSKQAIELATKLCEGIEELNIEHNYNDVSKFVTASFGLTLCDFSNGIKKDICQNVLYEEADKELYKAKGQGRNQVSFREIFS